MDVLINRVNKTECSLLYFLSAENVLEILATKLLACVISGNDFIFLMMDKNCQIFSDCNDNTASAV